MLPLTLTLLASAQAAEVTDIPPFLRGDIRIAYEGVVSQGPLLEDEYEVGRLYEQTHRIDYSAYFGAAPGVAVYVTLPSYVAERVSFADATEMIYEPTLEEGTLLGAPLLAESPIHHGKGLGGTWLGLQGTPFSESLFPGRGHRATWLIDFGYRFLDRTNFWSLDPITELRGGGPGGPATRLRTAFSTRYGVANPYMQFIYQHEGWIDVDLYTVEGQAGEVGAIIWPKSWAQVLTGTELVAWEDDVKGARYAVDLRFGWGYRSWSEVPSGIYLPSVLNSTDGTLVVRGEHSVFQAGLGLYIQPFKYMKIDIISDVGFSSPHRLEHPYDIHLGYGGLEIGGRFALNILAR